MGFFEDFGTFWWFGFNVGGILWCVFGCGKFFWDQYIAVFMYGLRMHNTANCAPSSMAGFLQVRELFSLFLVGDFLGGALFLINFMVLWGFMGKFGRFFGGFVHQCSLIDK